MVQYSLKALLGALLFSETVVNLMSSSDRPRSGESSPGRAIPISRATFLRAAAAVADGVAFPLLSACSSGGSASGGSTGASTGSTTGATLSAAEIATIKKFLGPTDAKYAGVGETWKIGGIFPFSTSGSVYGEVMGDGAKLAAGHIKQLGGPNIQIDFRDSAGSDVVKGAERLRRVRRAAGGAVVL